MDKKKKKKNQIETINNHEIFFITISACLANLKPQSQNRKTTNVNQKVCWVYEWKMSIQWWLVNRIPLPFFYSIRLPSTQVHRCHILSVATFLWFKNIQVSLVSYRKNNNVSAICINEISLRRFKKIKPTDLQNDEDLLIALWRRPYGNTGWIFCNLATDSAAKSGRQVERNKRMWKKKVENTLVKKQ